MYIILKAINPPTFKQVKLLSMIQLAGYLFIHVVDYNIVFVWVSAYIKYGFQATSRVTISLQNEIHIKHALAYVFMSLPFEG